MPTLLQTNLPEIMQQVETQLTTYISPITNATVCGSISNIYWVFTGQEPVPGTTGQRDLLLIERPDDTDGTVVGAGRFAWISSGLDINLRTTRAVDRRATEKQWMINQALLVNGLMDAMMGFFPVDANQNAYTIEGFVLDANAAPVPNRESLTWGETIGTYRFHYTPRINTAILG